MTFTAVAEVHVSEEDKFIAQASGQHVVCDTDHGAVPAILSAPPGDMLVSQLEMYFGSEDRPGRYTYGGGSGLGSARVFGSGRISGQ